MSLIAVTGSAGFLGRAVCAELAQNGHRVRGINRCGTRSSLVEETVTVGDLGTADLDAVVSGCDAVVNCAARVHITRREAADQATRRYTADNVALPVRLARAAKDRGVARFVQISSVAAVASSSRPGETVTDDTAPRPASPYGVSKLVADNALLALPDDNFAVLSLRPPAIYGPGVGAWFALLNRFARRGVPLPLARIANRRSFAFVGNIASAAAAALERGDSGAYIVTDSAPVSSHDLYSRLLRLHGHGLRSFGFPETPTRLAARIMLGNRSDSLLANAAFDGARFAETLDWHPPVDFDTGLRRTIGEAAA